VTINNCETATKHLRNIPSQHTCIKVLYFSAIRKPEGLLDSGSSGKPGVKNYLLPV